MIPPPTPEATRDEGVPAVEVGLADGRPWRLALPGPRLHPVTRREIDLFGRPRTRIELEARSDYPLEVWRLWDDVRAAGEGEGSCLVEAIRRLAVALLRMAHDLGPDEAEGLLDPNRVDLYHVAREFIPPAFGDVGPHGPTGDETYVRSSSKS